MTATQVFLQAPFNPQSDIITANGTTLITAVTAPAASGTSPGGCVLKNVQLSSDETSTSRTVQFWYNDRPMGQVVIPANSGSTQPVVDLFSSVPFSRLPFDALGNKYLQMAAGDTLKWNLVSGSVTAAKKLSFVTLLGGKF